MRLYDRAAFDTRTATPVSAPLRTVERERPSLVHAGVHTTREAEETRIDMHPEFDADLHFNPTSLKAPPPRPGYAQRWVADGTDPTAHHSVQRNWFSKTRQGFAPRLPETIPPGLKHLYPSMKLAGGQDAVRIAGMVLCEIPIEVARARRMAINDKIKEASASIPTGLANLNKRAQEAGLSPLQVGDKHQSYRGRPAPSYQS